MAPNFTDSDNTSPRRNRATCPDCAEKADGSRRLEHAATCPLGRAIDAVSDSDREWFAAHPAERERLRPMERCEAEEQRIWGIDIRHRPGRSAVLVTRICEGVRARRFGVIVAVPEDGAA